MEKAHHNKTEAHPSKQAALETLEGLIAYFKGRFLNSNVYFGIDGNGKKGHIVEYTLLSLPPTRKEVKVIQTPISERYCQIGQTATLDTTNNEIRCGGAWFKFDDRWIVE